MLQIYIEIGIQYCKIHSMLNNLVVFCTDLLSETAQFPLAPLSMTVQAFLCSKATLICGFACLFVFYVTLCRNIGDVACQAQH